MSIDGTLLGVTAFSCQALLYGGQAVSANSANINQPAPRDTPLCTLQPDAIRERERLLCETIPPLIAQGREAFRRDLPDLLKCCSGKWVAYSGSQQLGMGRTKTQLYQECLKRGLRRGEFIVLIVEPQFDDEIDLPLDV